MNQLHVAEDASLFRRTVLFNGSTIAVHINEKCMHNRFHDLDYGNTKPTHEFDARLVIDGRRSPLCAVKLWLPIDCHEDAHIQVTGQDPSCSPSPLAINGGSGPPRLVSEIDPAFGLEIEADDLHIRSVSTKHGLRVNGISITINHIGRLRLKQRWDTASVTEADPNDSCTTISFRLSDLEYGSPHIVPIADYHGNRKVRVSGVRTLKMQLSNRVVKLELQRHWNWYEGKFDRLVAGSFPVLVVKNCQSLKWEQFEEIQKLGQDAGVLLSLAARHLTVVHVMVATTKKRHLEEWTYPLNRQRSTTEEKATGPLIDESDLEDYFLSASAQWLALTDQQRDAIRLAVFSIHPFVQSSSEGAFLSMFTALEGLAKAWFPGQRRLHKKIGALVTAFPPRVGGLWPVVAQSDDGLDAIRNHLAHGGNMRGQRQEALSVGTDHLQVWIERILLSILDFPHKLSPHDWISRHVQGQRSQLQRLRAAVKA
jgi:hypothetical protein